MKVQFDPGEDLNERLDKALAEQKGVLKHMRQRADMLRYLLSKGLETHEKETH